MKEKQKVDVCMLLMCKRRYSKALNISCLFNVLLCETFGLKKVSDPYENGMVGVSPCSPSV